MDWKRIFTEDFLMDMIALWVGLFIWEKWIKKMLKV